eukprot:XP_025002091.1 platelet glycoprotein VI-like isoform X3 [Gallus gallus]
MAAMTVALFLGWWLVTASEAQQLHRPSLSLHPSQAVSMGENVTLRCHLPRMATWVQLWHNGSLRFNKEKDKEQDTAEFSFAVTNLEDTGTYQCRYQVSKPLRTSKKSDPVELVLTGVTPEMPESVQLQVSVGVIGPQIPVHFLGPTPRISMETQTFPMGTPNDPQTCNVGNPSPQIPLNTQA